MNQVNTTAHRSFTHAAARPATLCVHADAGWTAGAWKHLSIAGLLCLAACSSSQVSPPSPSRAPAPASRPLPPGPSVAYRTWDKFRLHAGRRLVQTNPNGTFTGAVPEPLLAIPVLEVELNADGSVRRIVVQRQPSQARDTVQLAIEAVQRAAPFGDVSHLPRPWKFSEVFLFRDDRRFKPRVLDI